MFDSIRRFLSLQRLIGALAGFGFAILLTAITDALAAQSLIILGIIAGIALMAWLISILVQRPSDIEVSIQAPQTIRMEYDALYIARQAFVGFVPLYRPLPGSSAKPLTEPERQAALEALDRE